MTDLKDKSDIHENTKDYYGSTLKGTKTLKQIVAHVKKSPQNISEMQCLIYIKILFLIIMVVAL